MALNSLVYYKLAQAHRLPQQPQAQEIEVWVKLVNFYLESAAYL